MYVRKYIRPFYKTIWNTQLKKRFVSNTSNVKILGNCLCSTTVKVFVTWFQNNNILYVANALSRYFFYLKLFFVKLTDRILHYTSYWVTWAEYIHVFIIHRFLNHDSVFLGGFLARCEITRELVMKWPSKCINFWICHLFVFAYISFSVNRQSII